MKQETIEFSTGMLIIADDNISFKRESGNNQETQTMRRFHIGGVNNEHFIYTKRQPIQYGFRLGFLGLALFIFSAFTYSSKGSFSTYLSVMSTALMVFGLFLIFGDMIIGGLFGSGMIRSITQSMFGKKCYLITVVNESGGDNIEFLIELDELGKTENIQSFRLEEIKVQQYSTSNLDELKKLADLKDLGILTQQEFEQKKKELLNI